MSFRCLIDGMEFETEKKLHSYISRTKKMKLEEYYPHYYPKHDLLTGEAIKFTDKEHYFVSYFNSRENLVKFFQKTGIDIDLVKNIIGSRATLKGLKFAPSTVEARTSILPTPML